MHIDGTAAATGDTLAPVQVPVADEAEARTRDRVARTILQDGPITATDIAQRLGLTTAAVRRHLDAFVAAGLAAVREPVRSGGRGRPARAYVLTPAGHDHLPMLASAYDDLASSAMAYLAEQLGPQAIEAFAESRVADLEARYGPVVDAAGSDVAARTKALAGALAGDGYAASTRPTTTGGDAGTQLCQGHCPVQHVATRVPQLCEAETEVFSRLLGVHVQRLATLAGGAHVCTTHVPLSTTRTSDGRIR